MNVLEIKGAVNSFLYTVNDFREVLAYLFEYCLYSLCLCVLRGGSHISAKLHIQHVHRLKTRYLQDGSAQHESTAAFTNKPFAKTTVCFVMVYLQ